MDSRKSSRSETITPTFHSETERDRAWLARAEALATAPVDQGGSPHPTTRVGALFVDLQNREVAAASNRFAQGVNGKAPDRLRPGHKSLWVNCAEQMALAQAVAQGATLRGTRLYVTLEPCAVCAGLVIEAGVLEVIVPATSVNKVAALQAKWRTSLEVGRIKLAEAGVRVRRVPSPGTQNIPQNALPKDRTH